MSRQATSRLSYLLIASILLTVVSVSFVIVPTQAFAAAQAYGDIDGSGKVDLLDLMMVKKFIVKKMPSFPNQDAAKAADVNNDGIVNAMDYLMMKQFTTGKISKFPADENNNDYIAYDELYSMTDSSINRATSTHFQIVWGSSGNITNDFVQGNLKNLERIREYYINELGMPDSGVSINSAYSGTKRKTNLYIANTGLKDINTGEWDAHMGSDSKGMGYMVICPEGLRVDPPSTVTAHEYGHVITYCLKGWNEQTITGPWWESAANWFMERYMSSDYYSYNGKNYSPESEYFGPLYENLSRCSPNKDDYYQYWPLLLYLEENPDHLDGLGKGFVKKMIKQDK